MTDSAEFVGEGSLRAALAPNVRVRTFDGELVVLDSVSGDYFALNDVGRDFVLGLTEGRTVAECARSLHAAYDVAWDALCADLDELVRELLARTLLVRVP